MDFRYENLKDLPKITKEQLIFKHLNNKSTFDMKLNKKQNLPKSNKQKKKTPKKSKQLMSGRTLRKLTLQFAVRVSSQQETDTLTVQSSFGKAFWFDTRTEKKNQ